MGFVFYCPACGAELEKVVVFKGKSFQCPVCHEELLSDLPFNQSVFWVSVAVSPIAFYAIGLRGFSLALTSLIAWVPIGMVFRFMLNLMLPPKVRLSEHAKKATEHSRCDSRI